jgi:hypothetical protein
MSCRARAGLPPPPQHQQPRHAQAGAAVLAVYARALGWPPGLLLLLPPRCVARGRGSILSTQNHDALRARRCAAAGEAAARWPRAQDTARGAAARKQGGLANHTHKHRHARTHTHAPPRASRRNARAMHGGGGTWLLQTHRGHHQGHQHEGRGAAASALLLLTASAPPREARGQCGLQIRQSRAQLDTAGQSSASTTAAPARLRSGQLSQHESCHCRRCRCCRFTCPWACQTQ